MHKFKTTGIFLKFSSYGNFVTTFGCLILARTYNSPRDVSVKGFPLPVASEPTLRATKLQNYKALKHKILQAEYCNADRTT